MQYISYFQSGQATRNVVYLFLSATPRENADPNSHFLLILLYKMVTSGCMYLMDTVVIDLRKLVKPL